MSNLYQRLSPSALGLLLMMMVVLSTIKDSQTVYTMAPETTTVSPVNLLPYFDFDVPRNLTVTVGQTGFLHCRVERLGDKDVSWIRKRDLHILTAGSTTYTSDQRFQVIRPENSANWTLQIKYPQPRDSGIYECQINTEPKMSLSYTFNVVELKAEILGPTDLYVKSGSDINLTCRISQGPHELGNIFWYKGSEIIDMATNQNEIDGSSRISVDNDWSDGLASRLKIRRAMPSDTGNYTCVPTIAKSASVYVHVIIGEHPAAMQHNSSSMNNSNFYCSICCMLFTIFTCCLQHLLLVPSYIRAATTSTSSSKSASRVTPKTKQLSSTVAATSLVSIPSSSMGGNSLSIPSMAAYLKQLKASVANLIKASVAALVQHFIVAIRKQISKISATSSSSLSASPTTTPTVANPVLFSLAAPVAVSFLMADNIRQRQLDQISS